MDNPAIQAAEANFSDKKTRIFDFLRSQPIGILSTVTPEGKPHGSVIYFGVDENGHISFLTKTGTRKYANLKDNPAAVLNAVEPTSQTTVQITGDATELPENSVKMVADSIIESAIKTSDSGTPPLFKLEEGDFAAFRLTPSRITMAVYARPTNGSYNELFETLEADELKS